MACKAEEICSLGLSRSVFQSCSGLLSLLWLPHEINTPWILRPPCRKGSVCASAELLGISGKGWEAFDGCLLRVKVRPEVKASPGASTEVNKAVDLKFTSFTATGCCPPSRSPPPAAPATPPWLRRPRPHRWPVKRTRWTGPTMGASRRFASRCLRRIRRTRATIP